MSVGTPRRESLRTLLGHSFDHSLPLAKTSRREDCSVQPSWEGYGPNVIYRGSGASRAAQLGAVAVLVRSMTGHSLQLPTPAP